MFTNKFSRSRRQLLALPMLGLISHCSYYSHIVRKLEGEVKINGKSMTTNTAVQVGDMIATGQQSRIVFTLGEDAYNLGAQSVLQLGQAQTDSLWLRSSYADDTTRSLRLLQGTLIAVFGKGEKQITVPTASIGIRGTGLCLNVEHEHTYFCTCYGETEIITPTGRQFVKATHHKANVISHNATPYVTSGKKEYHEDQDLNYLESLVGRQTPASFR